MSKTRRNWYLLGGAISAMLLLGLIGNILNPCGAASEQLKSVKADRKRMEERYDFIGLRVNDPKLWQAEDVVRKSCSKRL